MKPPDNMYYYYILIQIGSMLKNIKMGMAITSVIYLICMHGSGNL